MEQLLVQISVIVAIIQTKYVTDKVWQYHQLIRL